MPIILEASKVYSFYCDAKADYVMIKPKGNKLSFAEIEVFENGDTPFILKS